MRTPSKKPETIRPHPRQIQFLKSKADIAIFGGAAGGGKSFGLLLEPLRHVANPGFTAAIFRRTHPELIAPRGLWQQSMAIYPRAPLNGTPNKTELQWTFPSGAVVRFAALQHEADRLKWGGSEIAVLGFDQLETFEAEQFWFMLSRNRSTCGVRPYIRATANPRPGWLADFISWWIDQDSGYAIAERAGKLRWFTRHGDTLRWHDAPTDGAKSVTFIPSTLADNPTLTTADPGYAAALAALPHVERERLEKGNWKIFNEGSEWPPECFGNHIWFESWPAEIETCLRVMSLDPSQGRTDTSDYSAWILLTRTTDGVWWCEADMKRRPVSRIVADGLLLAERFKPHMACCESNAFQFLIQPELSRCAERANVDLPILGVNNTLQKEMRIRRIGPVLAENKIRFRRTLGTQLLMDQLKAFPACDHDDGPDALEQGMRLWTHVARQRHAARHDDGIHTVIYA